MSKTVSRTEILDFLNQNLFRRNNRFRGGYICHLRPAKSGFVDQCLADIYINWAIEMVFASSIMFTAASCNLYVDQVDRSICLPKTEGFGSSNHFDPRSYGKSLVQVYRHCKGCKFMVKRCKMASACLRMQTHLLVHANLHFHTVETFRCLGP